MTRCRRRLHDAEVGRVVLQADRERDDFALALAIAKAFSMPSADSRIGISQIGRVMP